MWGLIALGVASLVGSIVSSVISANTARQNYESQERINAENVQAQQDINSQNVQAQKEINQQNIDYSREFAQNGIQWKMEDLQAAGLNPTLAAGMSASPSPTALSAPTQKAPVQQAPMLDMSGVSNAIMAMSNMMLTTAVLGGRNNIMSERNDIMSDKNDVLRNLYRRKAQYMESSNSKPFVGSAKQIADVRHSLEKQMSPQDIKKWDDMLKELERMR